MFYRGKELRRLWEVEIFTGKTDVKKPKTRTERVIAWNAVDAIQRCGGKNIAKRPVDLGFVTWPETDKDGLPVEPTLKIKSTAGPEEEVVETTLGNEGDWGSKAESVED